MADACHGVTMVAITDDDLDRARSVTSLMMSRAGRWFTWDEVFAEALYGLVLASCSWDDSAGAAWPSWSWRRMSGQVMDAIRQVAGTRAFRPVVVGITDMPETEPDEATEVVTRDRMDGMTAEVTRILSKLSRFDRETLQLRYLEGLSGEQTVRELRARGYNAGYYWIRDALRQARRVA